MPKGPITWTDDDVMAALEAMQKENERLINAIAEHVTVRAEKQERIAELEAALPVDYWEQNCLLREKQERIEQLEAELAESERQTRAQLSRVMKRDERIEQLEADKKWIASAAEFRAMRARVAELEADLEAQEQVAITWMEMANDKDEHIEQLEAALRQIIDYHDIGGEHVITCQRIAKQTLGEKK